jgi:hypothetical protein
VTRSLTGAKSGSVRANRIQLRVFAEGKKTESLYLNNWHRLYREKVIISVAPHECTTPFELTEVAGSQRRNDLRQAKRGRGTAFDEYWCMFDVDEHPKIPDALQLVSRVESCFTV